LERLAGCLHTSSAGPGNGCPFPYFLSSTLVGKWRFSAQAGGVEGSKFCQNLILKSVTISLVALSFWKEHGAFMIIPHILKENKF
jgi:hypothetical protein